ncbi:hypothetical protein VTK56DRAFT_7091 [Thermocarpiscus australiensis]
MGTRNATVFIQNCYCRLLHQYMSQHFRPAPPPQNASLQNIESASPACGQRVVPAWLACFLLCSGIPYLHDTYTVLEVRYLTFIMRSVLRLARLLANPFRSRSKVTSSSVGHARSVENWLLPEQ